MISNLLATAAESAAEKLQSLAITAAAALRSRSSLDTDEQLGTSLPVQPIAPVEVRARRIRHVELPILTCYSMHCC